MNMKLSLIR